MKKILKKISILTAIILFSSCDKTGLGSSLNDVYIPDFSNTWTKIKGNVSGHFNFNTVTVTDSSKGTGTFSGFNIEDDINNTNLAASGTFVNIKITMTISSDSQNPGTPPKADSSFTGIYDTLTKDAQGKTVFMLRLINTAAPHDSLVLQHG
jgi:hypothetical protein